MYPERDEEYDTLYDTAAANGLLTIDGVLYARYDYLLVYVPQIHFYASCTFSALSGALFQFGYPC